MASQTSFLCRGPVQDSTAYLTSSRPSGLLQRLVLRMANQSELDFHAVEGLLYLQELW